MTSLQSYTTVNSNSNLTISLNSVSHIIENNNKHPGDTDLNQNGSTWIYFNSGKSVHVRENFHNVNEDLKSLYR